MKPSLTLGIIGCALLTFLTPNILSAQAGDFGTNRQPRTCRSQSEPRNSPISSAQAKIYAACNGEKQTNNYSVKFIDILDLEVAPTARRASIRDIQYDPRIDTQKPVYDIRGNVVSYSCFRVSDLHPAGQNCIVYRVPNSKGKCFQNTFGEWSCALGSYSPRPETKMPAPN